MPASGQRAKRIGRKRKRARGTLTREEIAEAALALLDADGVEAVTMRQIADALGVAPMSLYVHAENKEDILQAATDLVLAQLPHADTRADPRAATIAFFERFHVEMVEHPSVAETIATTPVVGPATFAAINSCFEVLARAGLSEREAVSAVTALMSYTLGFTQFAIARDLSGDSPARDRRRGIRRVDPEEFPSLHAVRDQLMEGVSDEQFTDGLSRLVASYLPDRPT